MQDEDEDDGNKIFSTSFVFASVRDKSISAIRRVIPTYACEEDDATVEFKEEKYLSNGDIYFGELSNGIPNGLGKYVWNDGCMYEGEWISGNTSGRGKFSWPSGATFEGEFKDGRIEGIGTLIGSDGSVYKGSWISDQKTGIGKKYYANGDFYEGFWRNDLQDGYGRYVWKNGNEYVGEWKSGIVSGHGILKWIDGSKYDGFWENGIPKGNGFFTSTHGKPCFINWSKDLNRNQQRFRDDLCLLEAFEEKFSDFKKRPCNHHDGILGPEKKLLPRICVWDSDDKAGDITCDILGVEEAASKLDFGGKIFEHDGLGLSRRSGSPCSFSGEIKKPGQTISQGHRNYDLMLSIQVGIRYSVGKMASVKARDTVSSDFYAKEKCWTKFPPEGSKVTPPHHSVEFKWRDYFPMVFRNLRELFMVDPADYMLAICGNDALRELSSPGKSGSFFYITQDDRFMIKTVKKSEVKVLLKMLPSYYRHVSQNQHSLITKFYGVHCIRSFGNQKVRFVVMGNFFCSDYQIHKRFDLKGSSYGRITHKSEEGIDETTTLKDLDLNFVFHLQKFWFHELLKQIDQDCEFLEAVGIMDYSLLVGVHFCEGNKKLSQKTDNEVLGECIDSHNSGSEINQSLYLRKHVIRLGSNMPATAEEVRRRNDVVRCGGSVEPLVGEAGKTYEVILYFGIIDILQNYDVTKKLEHAYKSLQIDSISISAVDPKFYARRFKDFIRSVFVEDG